MYTSEAGSLLSHSVRKQVLNNHLLPLTNTLEPDQESTLQACSRFSKLQYSVTVGRLMSNIHGTGNPTRKACAHSEELDDTLPTCPTAYQGLSGPFWTKPSTDAVLNVPNKFVFMLLDTLQDAVAARLQVFTYYSCWTQVWRCHRI